MRDFFLRARRRGSPSGMTAVHYTPNRDAELDGLHWLTSRAFVAAARTAATRGLTRSRRATTLRSGSPERSARTAGTRRAHPRAGSRLGAATTVRAMPALPLRGAGKPANP